MTSLPAKLNSELAVSWTMYTPAQEEAVYPKAGQFAEDLNSPKTPIQGKGLRLVVLGEAPGEEEERFGVPFVGTSGRTLREWMFPKAGLNLDQWHLLNVFCKRPPNNDLKAWTRTKTELKKEGITPVEPNYRKRYFHPDHFWQLAECDRRLRELKPDLIVCLGGTALWALTGEAAIGNYRGNFFWCERYQCWAIATYHPAALLYQWSNMPYAWADLNKVSLWLRGELPKPLSRRFYINPTFMEMAKVYATFKRNPSWNLGVDIETAPGIGQITTISYSTPTLGICIPIWDKNTPAGENPNFWPTAFEELKAWKWIKEFAELPNSKSWQNGLYDSQYLLDAPLQIRVLNVTDDTAIMQHASQPELQKALGTLASLYLNEPAWKFMRTQDKDVNKADD